MIEHERYQAYTPKNHPHITLHQRVDGEGAEAVITVVGVQLHGGLIHYTTEHGGASHLAAIQAAADNEAERVAGHWATKALHAVSTRQAAGQKLTPAQIAQIHADHKQRGVEQVSLHRTHIIEKINNWAAMIGPHDPDLAPALAALVEKGA